MRVLMRIFLNRDLLVVQNVYAHAHGQVCAHYYAHILVCGRGRGRGRPRLKNVRTIARALLVRAYLSVGVRVHVLDDE